MSEISERYRKVAAQFTQRVEAVPGNACARAISTVPGTRCPTMPTSRPG
jgi:hypothetical protein